MTTVYFRWTNPDRKDSLNGYAASLSWYNGSTDVLVMFYVRLAIQEYQIINNRQLRTVMSTGQKLTPFLKSSTFFIQNKMNL